MGNWSSFKLGSLFPLTISCEKSTDKAQQGGRSVKNIPCAIKKLGVILQKTQSLQLGVIGLHNSMGAIFIEFYAYS